MTIVEITKALRLCSAVNSSCEECPCNDPADDLCECANKVGIAAADAIENLLTENAALRRHIDNLTDAQAVMVKEFTEKLEELEQVKVERDAARRAVCGMCHKPPDALPPGARCAQKDCQWHPHTQKEV